MFCTLLFLLFPLSLEGRSDHQHNKFLWLQLSHCLLGRSEREAFHDTTALVFQGYSMLKCKIFSIIFVLISANMVARVDDMKTNCSWWSVQILVRTGGMLYYMFFILHRNHKNVYFWGKKLHFLIKFLGIWSLRHTLKSNTDIKFLLMFEL